MFTVKIKTESMQIYCDAGKNPSAFQCARTALLQWLYSVHPQDGDIQEYYNDLSEKLITVYSVHPQDGDIQEYYNDLSEKLITENIITPTDFCHKKKASVRKLCKDNLKHYFMCIAHSGKVKRTHKGVKHQEFVRNYRCSKKVQRKYAANYAFFQAVYKYAGDNESFEDEYISDIHQKILLDDNMESPEEFCRNKYEPDYEKPEVL